MHTSRLQSFSKARALIMTTSSAGQIHYSRGIRKCTPLHGTLLASILSSVSHTVPCKNRLSWPPSTLVERLAGSQNTHNRPTGYMKIPMHTSALCPLVPSFLVHWSVVGGRHV